MTTAQSDNTTTTVRRTRSLSKGLVDLSLKVNQDPDFVFDVVIVGSGYGGSVAAQQFAGLLKEDGTPLTICLLERGAEYLPGMFPSAISDLPTHVRYGAQATGKVTGNHEGLFDIRLGSDVSALIANGLGGGSLINAGVMLAPDFTTFTSKLPDTVETDLRNNYFALARSLILGAPLTVTVPNAVQPSSLYTGVGNPPAYPLKFQRLSDLGQRNNLSNQAADISVAITSQTPNPYSVGLNACIACGDCMTGCNVGAKASLDTNLLAQAKHNGAEIYTGASVLKITRFEKAPDTRVWLLDVVHTSTELRRREKAPLPLKAHKVILAAGALGSPEILLRSRSGALSFSNKLGEQFSCNGDNIAAIHKLPLLAHSSADEFTALDKRGVGPTITNMVQVPKDGENLGFWIQEFAIPAPIKRLFSEIVTTSASLAELTKGDQSVHGAEHHGDVDSCAVDDDAIEKTLVVGLIGHDSADGCLRLPLQPPKSNYADEPGTLQIVWPSARQGHQLNQAYKRFEKLSEKAFPDAVTLTNPMWRLLPGNLADLVSQPLGPVLTVHPLGGCPIGSDAAQGVVDDCGRVYNLANTAQDNWFGSLLVLDGSIVPTSLGANPSLMIAALALRACAFLKQEWKYAENGKTQADKLPSRPIFSEAKPSETKPTQATEVEVVERLSGHVNLQVNGQKPDTFFVELTLAYEAKPIRELMQFWGGRSIRVDPAKSCVRIFESGSFDYDTQRYAYDSLRFLDDDEREKHVICKAPLEGTLKFLHREHSTKCGRMLRGLHAYLRNRGKRDIWQAIVTYVKKLVCIVPTEKSDREYGVRRFVCDAFNAASRAGEVRRFDYDLTVLNPNSMFDSPIGKFFTDVLSHPTYIKGEKRLTYNRRANPWQQLTTLVLTQFPALDASSDAQLLLDMPFLARQGLPLIRVVKQENLVNTSLDMASFGLFMTRVFISIHLWTFRQPDKPASTPPERLPGKITGLPAPEVTLLTVDNRTRKGAVVHLTRYPQAKRLKGHEKPLAPLVFIHGYSVSGNTFTHPSLKPSAAEYFWRKGRDIWIVDLRTSTGLATATLPWSIEEVALIDIPAALLHIKNITGQRVDLVAHCIGAAMTSMALLTDANDIFSSEVELGVDTYIPPQQLGTLAAFNGTGGQGVDHPTVRTVVLSQKGPLLRYSADNVFRAYMLRALRRWLLPAGYQFQPAATPKVADQLIDRLLSSLPYPKADYDIENPAWPWQTTPWTATRHRMDALYARDFAAANLSAETLNAIDDLFGPINLDTVSQTMHFVRFSCITNQAGRGEFVTLASLKKRWSGIPTLAIHGAGNGMVDVSTQELLEENFVSAGVPFKKITYPHLEHQDVWIGESASQVFEDIEEFLTTAPPQSRTVTQPHQCWRFDVPWIGPRLQKANAVSTVLAMSSPRYGKAKLLLVPVKRSAVAGYTLAGTCLESIADSSTWLSVSVPCESLNGAEKPDGWLAVMAYEFDQTTLTENDGTVASDKNKPVNLKATAQSSALVPIAPARHDARANATTFFEIKKVISESFRKLFGATAVTPLRIAEQIRPLIASATVLLTDELTAWLNGHQDTFETGFIDNHSLLKLCATPVNNFSFLLGSCRYPAGLFDETLSVKSLSKMASLTQQAGNQSTQAVDFAIFTGDQIYADASAGLADASRIDERFDLRYEKAFRTKAMRDIMRSVPVHMMLDDHEIIDNWEPACPSNRQAASLGKLKHQGLRSYWHYQRMANQLATGFNLNLTSYPFDHGCASFYMLDTRSQRQHRNPGDQLTTAMFSDDEQTKLHNWMSCDARKGHIKFIVSPSIILPRRLSALQGGADDSARSDAWAGYPGNLSKLFKYIVDKQIQNVVFLSGDEHLACVATASLAMAGKNPVQITSVHASGLYAPFPFSNSKIEDFVEGVDHFSVGSVICSVNTVFAPKGDSFACIEVTCVENKPQIKIQLHVGDLVLKQDDDFKPPAKQKN